MRALEALQATLAAEHAAVHVYAVIGGRISVEGNPVTAARLRAAYDVHRARRDQLRSVIADLGRVPQPAAAGYQVDAYARDPVALVAVALTTEQRCAAVYAQLVSASTGKHRRWAIEALTDAALRELELGGAPDTYPGLTELQDRTTP